MAEPVTFSRRDVNRALLAAAFDAFAGGRASAKIGALGAGPLFDFAIAGGFHHGLQGARATLRPGMLLGLRREPDNPHDADAIAVHRGDGLMLGYVPRRANTPIARLLDAGRCLRAEVVAMLLADGREDIPDDLVFTCFTSGDPKIRLTVDTPSATPAPLLRNPSPAV